MLVAGLWPLPWDFLLQLGIEMILQIILKHTPKGSLASLLFGSSKYADNWKLVKGFQEVIPKLIIGVGAIVHLQCVILYAVHCIIRVM